MAKTADQTETEVDRLAEAIRYHNGKYWVEHKPEISDVEYDQLVEKLRALDPQNPVLLELVEETAEDEKAFPKVKHDVPMLSIEKAFKAEDVVAWAADAGAFPSGTGVPARETGEDARPTDGLAAAYKVDGVSCSLRYEHGELVRAASRGNGVLGDDITRNAKTIGDIPHSVPGLKHTALAEIRGEIYMSLASFKEALDRFEQDFKEGLAREEERPTNPRNYCAGSIKQKDSRVTAARKLSFLAHHCVGKLPEADGKSEVNNMQALEKLGFKTPFIAHVAKPADVTAVIEQVEKERKTLGYEIDGVVFAVNRLRLHQELGYTAHHPRFRLAFKFGRDRGETTVVKIIWHTTRSGRVAPAMQVEPIALGGATVTLCTLHNAKTVRDTRLAVGNRVLLEREVIPYFVQKLSDKAQEAELPTHCADCKSELVWDETQTQLVCPNLGGCPSQIQDYLAHYVSRGVTNMVGVGEELIAKLFHAGLVKSPPDFYKLTEETLLQHREALEPMGEIKARNVVTAIQERREQPLETFLVGLGIRGLGPSVAARLSAEFRSLDALLQATPEDLMRVEGIAETLAAGVRAGLQERRQLIAELLKQIKLAEIKPAAGPLNGKSFCLTGHIEFDFAGKHYDARPDIEELLKAHDGAVKGVSKTLDFLVVGDEAGSKVEKAKKAGVRIIDGAELVRMLGGH